LLLILAAIEGGAQEDSFMEADYKSHRITIATWHLKDTQGWRPKLEVRWSVGENVESKPLITSKSFLTEIEAEQYGLARAKQWIDDGKPDLLVGEHS
jgi:hypothetical protein